MKIICNIETVDENHILKSVDLYGMVCMTENIFHSISISHILCEESAENFRFLLFCLDFVLKVIK